MARNRRRAEGEVTYSWIVVRLLLFVLIVGVVLGILFLKNRTLRQGEELRVLEREVKLAQQKTSALETQLAHYKTPRELENKMARLNLVMVRPAESQIRRVPEPEESRDGLIRPRMLVQADPGRSR